MSTSPSEPSTEIRQGDAERVRAILHNVGLLKEQGLVHRQLEDTQLDGRLITLAGKKLINFGSCSYLGLETDPRLKDAACDAVMRYGTQFSSSRAYASVPLYEQLESLLSQLVGGHPVVLAASTSLAHLATLPLLVETGDAVLFDLNVHNSVQAVLPTLKLMGAQVVPAPHGRHEQLEGRIAALAARSRRVHYLCDGVYSMRGDLLDVAKLTALLERHPSLHAYVDDAHGVGWTGRHGRGLALGAGPLHERMVVVLGLAKSFGAAGGVVVTTSAAAANLIRTCGSTLIFSGPLAPAQLGAGIASARIHLSDELAHLQATLRERIALFDALALERGLFTVAPQPSPIRFVEVGPEEAATALGARLLAAGIYINVAIFPAVPRGRAGIRLMVNRRHEPDDIHAIVAELSAAMDLRRAV